MCIKTKNKPIIMKPENFENFTKEHLGKDVIATVRNPKKVIKGKLEIGKNPDLKEEMHCIRNGETTFINHENVKSIDVVLTKNERVRRKKSKFLMN
jgi:hypothetical protein